MQEPPPTAPVPAGSLPFPYSVKRHGVSISNMPLAQGVDSVVSTVVNHALLTELLEHNPLYVLTTRLVREPQGSAPFDISVHLCDRVRSVEFEPTGRGNTATASDGDYLRPVVLPDTRAMQAAGSTWP